MIIITKNYASIDDAEKVQTELGFMYRASEGIEGEWIAYEDIDNPDYLPNDWRDDDYFIL